MGIEQRGQGRLQHLTAAAQQHLAGVRSEDYWEYQPQQRVQTTDGIAGVVTAVYDGPFPGSEEYQVTLDKGLGGGTYTASQLRPAAATTASVEGTAAADYPELGTALVDHPDPAKIRHYASYSEPEDEQYGGDDPDDEPYDPACAYPHEGPCPFDHEEGRTATLRTVAMPAKSGRRPEGFSYRMDPDKGRLVGYINGQKAGTIDHSALDEDGLGAHRGDQGAAGVEVHMLHTLPHAQGTGVASAMMDALYHHYPNAWINHGFRTREGSRWWNGYEEPAPSRNVHNVDPDEEPGHTTLSHPWTSIWGRGDVRHDMDSLHRTNEMLGHEGNEYRQWDHPDYEFGKGGGHVDRPRASYAQAYDGETFDHDDEESGDDHEEGSVEHANPQTDPMTAGQPYFLPPALHHYVHDESHPAADRAQALLHHIGHGNLPNNGWYQEAHDAKADSDAVHTVTKPWNGTEHDPRGTSPDVTHLLFHSMPRDDHELEPRKVENDPTGSVSFTKGTAPLRLSGISWMKHGDGAQHHHHDFNQTYGEKAHTGRVRGVEADPSWSAAYDESGRKKESAPPQGPQPGEGQMKLFSSLVTTAALDGDFRFHVTAAWRDVVNKAKRIRSEGGVRVTLASDGIIFAEVNGDHHVYETGLQRLPGKIAAQSWSCGCKWGAYHWGADDDFSRFAGRMCSHALALQYEAMSRGMFGRDVHVDETKPAWVPRKVVVRYDIDADKNRLAPSTAKTAGYDYYGEWDGHDEDDEEHQSKVNAWDDIHEGLEGVHRGIGIHLRPEDHAIVHDEDRPVAERARHLLESIPRSHEGQRHGGDGNVGWHWSGSDGVGEDFAGTTSHPQHPGPLTGVVFHGHTPDRSAINEYPDESEGMIYGYHDHGEQEVPLHHGSHVDLKGVSWKDMDREEDDSRLGRPHPNGTPSMFFPYLGDFTHHEFSAHDPHHVYALRQAPLQAVARAVVAAGEDRDEVALALRTVGVHPDQGELFDSSPYKVERSKPPKSVHAEPEDDEEDGEECEHCGEPVNAPDHSEVHDDWLHSQVWHTPWEDGPYDDMAHTVHRGMSVELPHDVHKVVHDDERPMHERAKALLDHVTGSEGEKGLGPYWSDRQQTSREYATHTTTGTGNDYTPVVFHAKKPDMKHIITDPDDLESLGVYSFNHTNGDGEETNREVPIQHHAPVHLTGVSWGKPTYKGDPDEANWQRHNFDIPLKRKANVDSPFGEPVGTTYQLPRAPGATQKRRPWENPASAGPLAGADPQGWDRKLPLEAYASMDHSLFEPGAEATLHEEPEGALPATDGLHIPEDNEALTPQMTAGLKRQALKNFTLAEQQELIDEGEDGVKAANLDRLQIEGTHYAELESVLASQEDDATWLA